MRSFGPWQITGTDVGAGKQHAACSAANLANPSPTRVGLQARPRSGRTALSWTSMMRSSRSAQAPCWGPTPF